MLTKTRTVEELSRGLDVLNRWHAQARVFVMRYTAQGDVRAMKRNLYAARTLSEAARSAADELIAALLREEQIK